MFRSKKAFTLIELLVVIAIIGILATVSIISLSNARAKSRDAKRAGDVKQIQTALELFFNDNNRYPTATEWESGQIYSTSAAGTSTYLQVIPSAPTPNDGACTVNQNTINYSPTSNGSSYSISLCLGNTTGTLTPGPKCLTPGGIIDRDCSCGDSIAVASIAGHNCNESAPDYDKCTYDTVRVGGQCWLSQNLNVGSIVDGTGNQTDNSVLEKYCYDTDGNLNDYVSCQSDGGLYQWDEAMQYSLIAGSQGICPTGWHIPTDAELHILENYLKTPGATCNPDRADAADCDAAGTQLKVGGSSGFNYLITGYRENSFGLRGDYAYIWSSIYSGEVNPNYATSRLLLNSYSYVWRQVSSYRYYGLSVRCLKD